MGWRVWGLRYGVSGFRVYAPKKGLYRGLYRGLLRSDAGTKVPAS